jgi:hypothetical protein
MSEKACPPKSVRLSGLHKENRILREEREILKKAAVGSTGERNGLCQCSSRGAVGESLARSGVELQRDQIEVVLAVRREVTLLRQVLPEQSIRVLARAALPGLLGWQK